MKKISIITLLTILAILFTAVSPAFAQLGQTDTSSFTVQNVDTVDAIVTIHFFTDTGVEYTPTELNLGKSNPFTLTPGTSWEVYVPAIPVAQLPSGRYSVMIESSARVATIANLLGSGSRFFNGSYAGFSDSATTFYLPGVAFNYYGWYSLISVQNVTDAPINVNVTITCNNVVATGTLSATNVQPYASKHFVLKDPLFLPTGFTSGTKCNGSAVITGTGNIVVTDNQTVPTGGHTQSYSGVASGSPIVYIPALYQGYYGWFSSLNIQKLGSGPTTVSVTYSDVGSSTCNLTDAAPSCLLVMPNVHPVSSKPFAATITNSATLDLMVIANAAIGAKNQAQTYNGVEEGTLSSGIPSVMKYYYGWISSFTCQNVGTIPTTLNIKYAGYDANAYDTPSLAVGATIEKVTPNETFLPMSYRGGATVTANAAGAKIACIVNFNNPHEMDTTLGDWSMSYNAFAK